MFFPKKEDTKTNRKDRVRLFGCFRVLFQQRMFFQSRYVQLAVPFYGLFYTEKVLQFSN